MFGVIAVFIPSVIGIKLFDYLSKGFIFKKHNILLFDFSWSFMDDFSFAWS